MRKRFRKFIRRYLVKLIVEDWQANGEIRQLLSSYEQRKPVVIVRGEMAPEIALIDRSCNDPFRLIRGGR